MTYQKEYYEKNKKRIQAQQKEYRERNPESVRAAQENWRRNNEGHLYEADGYVRYIGYDHPIANPSGVTPYHRIVLWDKLLGQDAPCNWCGKTVYWAKKHPFSSDALVADHVNAIKNDNRPENIVPSCQRCNISRPGGRLGKPGNEKTQIGECTFEGCERSQVSLHLCSTHFNQQYAGKELTPIRKHKRSPRIDENGKHCTGCDTYKPRDDFYIRQGKPKGVCKKCEIERITKARRIRLGQNNPCSVEDCEGSAAVKEMCQKHYHQHWLDNRAVSV